MTSAVPIDLAANGMTATPQSGLQKELSKSNAASNATSESKSLSEDTVSIAAPTAYTVPMDPKVDDGLASEKRWPGWPGDCVFRLIVPVLKVGSIIGRKGELIKKTCEETHARIRVLEGAVGTPDRVVLISGKEDLDAAVSPAMDAVLKVFKRVSGLYESEVGAVGVAFCSFRLLVAAPQAVFLIGKQGSIIKSIQENSSASVRVLSGDEVPFFVASDERIVELQGEALKVKKALEFVLGHLRKFLVDHSVLPLFEKNYNTSVSQDYQVANKTEKSFLHTSSQPGITSEFSLLPKRESLFLDRETHMDSQITASGIPSFAQDPSFSASRSLGFHTRAPIVTQVVQTMQIPLSYAEDIIGVEGTNIAYIRRTSGSILTVQESRGLPDEITVEIKGSSSQVQAAQHLIHEFMSNHRETVKSNYGRIEAALPSSYSHLANPAFSASSLSGQSYGGAYGSSGIGGYSSFRL